MRLLVRRILFRMWPFVGAVAGRCGGAGALAGRDRAAARRPLAASTRVGCRVQPAALVGEGWRLRRRSRVGSAGGVGVRLLLVVGDRSRAAYGDAVGCGLGGSRE